jgi:hypothetical protein
MSLEEPDTATAGTEVPDHDGGPAWRRHPVVLGVAVATLTVCVAFGSVVLLDGGDDRRTEQETVAKRTPSQVLGGDEGPPPASVPGVPLVSIGAPGPNGCPAWWTVDDGGSPIIYSIVTHESAPAPPGPDGTEIGTALMVEKTPATTATVSLGGTIRVSAENSAGPGPTSALLLCR